MLESAITLIADGQLYYRGYDALALSTTASIEEVAALIWTGERSADVRALFCAAQAFLAPHLVDWLGRARGLSVAAAFQVLLPVAGAVDIAAYDLRPAAVMRAGARIMALLVQIAITTPREDGIARTLQACWVPALPQAAALFDTALILSADHELNASTFAARCVASTGATPYAAVTAGLAAASGPRHMGQAERVRTLLTAVTAPADAPAVIGGYLRRGEHLPGFGQPLYPQGDPRAVLLLQRIAALCPDAPTVVSAGAVADAAYELIGERPNIDYALAVLALALALPPDAAYTLFVLGRTVGWIGHSIEQYASGVLIRPRARYVGPIPRNAKTAPVTESEPRP